MRYFMGTRIFESHFCVNEESRACRRYHIIWDGGNLSGVGLVILTFSTGSEKAKKGTGD